MRRILRLLHYMRPYTVHVILSGLLSLVVGARVPFRILLIKPIIDNALSQAVAPDRIPLFRIPSTHYMIDLHSLVPRHFHNAWTVVAVALVGSALLKAICDNAGTLLTNKAGFGMITDLRNDLYDTMLRRSTAFFQRHSTGMLISTLINDIERVQAAMSTVLSDFLQQVFTLLFMIGTVIVVGGRMAWILLLFVPVIISSARRIGGSVRRRTRRGQDKLAEIQTIVVETITGNSIVKAFGMERWEMGRFRRAADRLLTANMKSVAVQSISSPLMDALGAVAIAMLLFLGRQQILHGMTTGTFITFLASVIMLYDPVRKMPVYYNSFQQALGASEEIFKFLDEQDEVVERKGAVKLKSFNDAIEFKDVHFSYDQGDEKKEALRGISLKVKRG